MEMHSSFRHTFFYFMVILLSLCCGNPAPTDCEKPQLELQVSPVKKRIQIYWNFHKDIKDGWIGVYSQQPDLSDPEKNRVCDPIAIDKPMGWFITDIKSQDNNKIDLKFDGPTYLGFSACAWRKNNEKDEALVMSDLQTYPRWMENYWENIKAVPINMLFLPGTHDSASYEGQQKSKSVWESIKKSTPGVKDQSFAQDSTIKQQLMLGIRYFDVRVKRDDNEYWTCHGVITMEKLDVVIADVVEFVTKTSKEIVIFDIHQLESGIASDNEHRDFANFLKEKFTVDNKPLFVNPKDFGPTPWLATPDQILAKGKVLVAYINVEFQRKDNCDILWPKVYQYWADKQSLDDLQKYIYEKIPGRVQKKEFTDRLTVIMAELTGNVQSTIFSAGHGLNDQAQDNDEQAQQWFLDPKVGMDTNVVAVDYFRSSGIVRVAIMWNERKFFKTNNCDPPPKFSDEYYEKILINP